MPSSPGRVHTHSRYNIDPGSFHTWASTGLPFGRRPVQVASICVNVALQSKSGRGTASQPWGILQLSRAITNQRGSYIGDKVTSSIRGCRDSYVWEMHETQLQHGAPPGPDEKDTAMRRDCYTWEMRGPPSLELKIRRSPAAPLVDSPSSHSPFSGLCGNMVAAASWCSPGRSNLQKGEEERKLHSSMRRR